MTSGQLLKKRLGLEKFPNVRINRAIATSYRIYFVWYNSYSPTMPITSWRLKQTPNVATMLRGIDLARGLNKRVTFSPLMDIEIFNGFIEGEVIIIPVDLAGFQLIRDDRFTKKFESLKSKEYFPIPIYGNLNHLNEFLTLSDFKSQSLVSDKTKYFRRQRMNLMGNENVNSRLIDLIFDTSTDSITFQFLTEVTELAYPDNTEFGEVDPNSFDIKRNPSKTYEIHLRFLQFKEWFDAIKEGKAEGEAITSQDIKELMDVSNVQIWTNTPSFHWQGGNYWLSQLDASIHPTDIAPKVWNQPDRHGEGPFITSKHVIGLLSQISFFRNQMAQKLTSKLKSRGML